MMNEFDFGKTQYHLKKIMKEKGVTLKQMSKDLGISNIVLERYYADSIQRFDLKIMTKICYYLDVDYSDIFTYIPPVEDEE